MKHISLNVDTENTLSIANIVVYGSFLEEHSFPDILLKAMCLEKTVIAPDLPMIRKYVSTCNFFNEILNVYPSICLPSWFTALVTAN